NRERLEMCQRLLKLTHVLNPMEGNVLEQLQEITGGDGASVVIDATGSQKAINSGFQYLAHGARYVLIGLQKGDISFSHPEFHKREATLMSSRNATREDFALVISSMKEGTIDPTTYITHRVGFDQLRHEFEKWLHPDTKGLIKAMVELN